jgi:hypothetical protein
MSGEEETRDRGFTIVDKRGESEPEQATPEAPRPELPRVDFTGLLLSLGNSALVHLGLVADPDQGEVSAPDLMLARNTIDTLEVLQEKTRGNLDGEEAKLLETLLAELRMHYVRISSS